MRNVQLETAMHAAGFNPVTLGEAIQVDPKTVERWVRDGRIPRTYNQWAVAKALKVEPSYLWPDHAGVPTQRSRPMEGVDSYPHRGLVPQHLWTGLLRGPTTSFSVLVYAGLPWFEADPGVLDCLRLRASEGVRIRLALGDPDCPAVARRGEEEGIDMAARVRNSLRIIEPLIGYPGIEVRLHATTLYTSLYISDTEVLANHHILGIPASQAPVLHVRRTSDGFSFDRYARSFEFAWHDARTYE